MVQAMRCSVLFLDGVPRTSVGMMLDGQTKNQLLARGSARLKMLFLVRSPT
jgi:hypothetical protein